MTDSPRPARAGFRYLALGDSYTIGEGVEPETLESIRAITEAEPGVATLVRALTMHFGPNNVLLTMEIQFRPALSAADVALAIAHLDRALRSRHPEVRAIFVETQSIAAVVREKVGPEARPTR